jgi:hypothetical protein
MLTLIGSTAAKHWFADFRTPKDCDYHSPEPITVDGADVFIDSRLSAWEWDKIATPSELYTLKVSHAFWEIGDSWNRHMADIVFFQRRNVEFSRRLYDVLLPIWKDIHKPKITNLNQTSKQFFSDAVKRRYVHDSVHQSIAYYDEPLFRRILKDGEEVLVDSRKFFNMDYDLQLQLVREEVYTTALERILIPNNYRGSPTAAYAWALRRTITSLFKGEWALWTVLNYSKLVMPDCDYRQRHLDNKHKLVEIK